MIFPDEQEVFKDAIKELFEDSYNQVKFYFNIDTSVEAYPQEKYIVNIPDSDALIA